MDPNPTQEKLPEDLICLQNHTVDKYKNQVLYRQIVNVFNTNKEVLKENPRKAFSQITHSLNDISVIGALLWKSPTASVADGLEIQYVHSPNYFIKETDDTNTTLDTYKSTGGYLILEDTGSDNFSASPESLSDGKFFVL